MKVVVVLFAAVVCFAAINAAPSEEQEPYDLYDDEPVPQEPFATEMRTFQMYNIFSPFFWHLKAALRTLKGVNCSIKEVIIIKAEAEAVLKNIQDCGADAVKTFINVIASSKKVIAICDNIIHPNEKVCNNNGSTNGKKTTPWSCTRKLFKELYLLRKQIYNTTYAIKKIPAIPGDAGYCTKSAFNVLIDVFNLFPTNVKICSKLIN